MAALQPVACKDGPLNISMRAGTKLSRRNEGQAANPEAVQMYAAVFVQRRKCFEL